jgi:hypothetical protein
VDQNKRISVLAPILNGSSDLKQKEVNPSKSSNCLDKLFRQKSACSTGDEEKLVLKASEHNDDGLEEKKEKSSDCAS